MSNSLGVTIEQAQVAFDNGDYRSVVDSCTRMINQFPQYSPAQRLLGQAYLEQGNASDAETWFVRVLSHNPRDPSAYLGLGLIAEDRGVFENALAYCQVAWELAPYDAYYREPVNRVAEKRYGANGELRLTHAALAQIHANAWRLRRAVKEYQSALIALPDRIDLWMGLAETLWILGEHDDAAEIAHEFLKDHHDIVPALVILTDIEHQAGNSSNAEKYLARLRRIDPDGILSASMVERNPQADRSILLISPDDVPELADQVDSVVRERPQIAPAPDFTSMLEGEDQQADSTDIEDLQPIRLEEFADDMPDIPPEPTTSSFVPEPLTPREMKEPEGIEAELLADDGAPAQAEAVEHQSDNDSDLNMLDMDLDDDHSAVSSDPIDESELEDIMADFEGIEPMSLDDFGASDEETSPSTPGFFEDSEIDFDFKIEDPDAVQIGGGLPAATPSAFGNVSEPGESDEDFFDLQDIDDEDPEIEVEVADADRATKLLDPSMLEPAEDASDDTRAEQQDAPPPPAETPPGLHSGTGFTRLLGELGSEGLAPFDPARTASDPSHGRSDTPGDETPAFPSLADGWDDIDAELASATPGGELSDTELMSIDELGLEPFALDDDEAALITPTSPEQWNKQADIGEPQTTSQEERQGADVGAFSEPLEIDDVDDLNDPDDTNINQDDGGEALDPHFDQRMKDMEQAARDNLNRIQGGKVESRPDDLHTNVTSPTAEHMVADVDLFQRSQAAKSGLIEQGVINGNREIGSVAPAEHRAEDAAPLKSKATPSLDGENNQQAIESRWQQAEELRTRNDIQAALSDYRWLIRHAPGRHDDIINALEQCIGEDMELDLAHRMLADIYRRHGDHSQARNHASMAMAARRKQRDIRQ